MERFLVQPRPNWQKIVEKQGFIFHSVEGIYWDESACYAFTKDEIDKIEEATEELHRMCLKAVAYVIENHKLSDFSIPEAFHACVEKSWMKGEVSIYGRFDLVLSENGAIKLLEYNADTPTSLLEASVIQWLWLEDFNENLDQFNSIHEKLIARFNSLRRGGEDTLHLACITANDEDYMNTAYLLDCATQGGLQCKLLDIGDIGWGQDAFWDDNESQIKNIFKLYPWEFIFEEPFGMHIPNSNTRWLEPVWKSILSNKLILKVLWDLFPEHPLLLPTFLSENGMKNYVKKPHLSREGANISIYQDGEILDRTQGEYGKEGFVFQQYLPIPDYGGNRPVIGSWIIGSEAAGIGIRETNSHIHNNLSRFVPHYFY